MRLMGLLWEFSREGCLGLGFGLLGVLVFVVLEE